MPTNVVLTSVGKDRIGIVAEISNLLFELGCNLLDSSMTLLRGEFAVILMVQLPEKTSIADLQKKLEEVEKTLGMKVYLRELEEHEMKEQQIDEPAYIVSVYGADKPGIVAGITKELADLKVNLTDVETKKTVGEKPIFLMVLEVTLPDSVDEACLKEKLDARARDLGVDISIQAVEFMEI